MSGAGAMVLAAPPCSSWTRVSRGTTMRTRLNPLGLCYDFISAGNLTISRLLGMYLHVTHVHGYLLWKNSNTSMSMIHPVKETICKSSSIKNHIAHQFWDNGRLRLTLILLIAEARMCCWIVEQPVGSVDTLPFHPRLDWLINHVVYVSWLDLYSIFSDFDGQWVWIYVI